MNRKERKIIEYGIVLLLVTFAVLTGYAKADAESLDTKENVTLTIITTNEDVAIPEVKVKLYRVAEFPKEGKLIPTDTFRHYPVDWDKKTGQEWKELSETLSSYIARDRIAAFDEGETNKEGVRLFPAKLKSLPKGVYLVIAEQKEMGDKIYSPQAFLVNLPLLKNDLKLDFDVKARVKHELNPKDKLHDRRVLKIWKDEGNESKRPPSIEVELLRDGDFYTKVELNEANNWEYIFKDLEHSYRWQVVEKTKIKDYKVLQEVSGYTFTITNTYEPEKPDNPPKIDPPSPNGEEEPSDPSKKEEPSPKPQEKEEEPPPKIPEGGSDGGGKLPQSGILWWKIQLTALIGTILVLFGWMRNRRLNNQEEEMKKELWR